LIASTALVAAVALLTPPAIDDASAQGFRLQGPRGGVVQPSMSRGPSKKSGFVNNSARPRGHVAGGPSKPKGGMGRGSGRNPNGNTADTRNPKGDRHRPRWPRPRIRIPGDIVVAIPGGPPSGPPSNLSGGQPPSNQPAQSGARASRPSVLGRRYVANEVVVEVAANVTPQTMTALARRHRLTQLETINLQVTGTSIRRLRINDRRSVPVVVRALEAEGAVMAVQPNYIATLQERAARMVLPADLEQYAATRLRVPEAHSLATGEQVLVAIIDSGVDSAHPELAGMIVDTFDAIGSGDRVHPHGTAIVGAIASRARLRGTAPAAHFLIARAFGTQRNSSDGTSVNIIKALDWAIARGARVINMSFAGDRDPAIERRLAVASGRGIVLVAAAGNAGPNSRPLYPAANPAVIAVTATDENDRLFRSAVRGSHIAVAAPGVDLWLPAVGGDYRMTSGTSFSAAEVSGVIALMLQRNSGLTPVAVRRALMATARDLGPRGLDVQFGAGLIDAYQAVLSVAPTPPAASVPVTAGAAAN
jgi:subtilisin family serine protease